MPSRDSAAGVGAHLAWERTLFDARWAVVSWPRRYGGREASLWEWLIFEEEYFRAGLPQRVAQNSIFLLAPSLFEFGNEAAGVAARASLQCHGAIGYAFEHDLHLWLKRVWSLQRAWGDTAQHRVQVAASILG